MPDAARPRTQPSLTLADTDTGAGAGETSPRPSLLDQPQVTAAMADRDRADVALIEAKQAVDVARARIRDALFAAGLAYRERRRPLPAAEIHQLYWDHPELRVTDVANAFGVSTSRLVEIAGPRTREVPCPRCGQPRPTTLTSRSAPRYHPCDDCRRRETEREERRLHELQLEDERRFGPDARDADVHLLRPRWYDERF